MAKTNHDFKGEATVAEFRDAVAGNWLDFPNIPKGTKIYIRTPTGAYHVAGIEEENSGVYLNAGMEANPQEVVIDVGEGNGLETVDPERVGDEF